MKNYAIMLMALTFLSAMAITASADYTCAGNVSNYTTSIYIASAPVPVSYNETCPYGCNVGSGECNPDPSGLGTIYFIFPLMAIVFLYMSSLLKPEDWALHIMLHGAALVFVFVPLGFMSQSLPIYGLYLLAIAVFVIIVLYNILRIFVRSHDMMTVKR